MAKGGPDRTGWRKGELAEARRLRAAIAAALREGRPLCDPAIVERSRRLDEVALRIMRRSGSGRTDGAAGGLRG